MTPARTFTLINQDVRDRACQAILRAPDGYTVAIAEALRTSDQNAKLWPMLTDVSLSMPMGRKETPEQWKAILMRAFGCEIGYLNDINGEPFPIGYRSSKMGKRQFAEFIEFIYAFGAEHGVQWSEPEARQIKKAV